LAVGSLLREGKLVNRTLEEFRALSAHYFYYCMLEALIAV